MLPLGHIGREGLRRNRVSIIDYDHLFESADEQIARSIHDEETTFFVSPWVKRNLDCAQYSKARGSEYEGPETPRVSGEWNA